MAQYTCIPSGKTVPPCPSGTAPDTISVTSADAPEYYSGNFDHIPVQDLVVLLLLVVCFLFGIGMGRK